MNEWAKLRVENENRHSERKEGRQEEREGERKGKREGEGKIGRQGRKEAAFSCFACSEWLRVLFPAGLTAKWVETMMVGGAHHYHSQNMCLLRRGVDTPFPPQREECFLFMGKAQVRGTWQGLHCRLNEEAAATPVTPKCCGENGTKMLSQMLTGGYQKQTWIPTLDPPFMYPRFCITKAAIRKQRRFVVGTFL